MAKTTIALKIKCLLCFSFLLCHAVTALGIKYKLDTSWPKDSSQFSAPIFSATVNSFTGNVFVARRNTNSSDILQYSQEGKYVKTLLIKGNTLEQVHGLTYHRDSNSLWATDVGNGSYGYTVKQYSLEGELLKVLGTPGTPGSSLTPLQFGNVADVGFDRDGMMYIADGDGGLNNRLVELNTSYNEVWNVGKNGTGQLDFRIPHSVAISPTTGNVWVADRMNNRLQEFDPHKHKLLASCQMSGGEPYSVRFSPDGSHLIVAQLQNDTIAFVSSKISQSKCETLGLVKLSPNSKPHLVDVDTLTGDFYVGNIGTPPACLRFTPG